MDILDKINPTKKEREEVNKVIERFLKKIKPRLKECRLLIGGSMGKDSWLAGDHDVDIFVKFPKNYYKKDISKILQDNLKGIKFQVIHGSREYIRIKQGNYLFEIIPVIDIKRHEEAANITDVSQLHVKWVKANNKDHSQIRLAKAFLKANNLYGAESYIKGFSGYVIELLTIYYNGFINLIKSATNWKDQVIIDIEKFYKNKEEIIKNLNKDKLSSLILIDPVQPDRNVAASLSKEKFDQFRGLCKRYLEKPHEEYFIEKNIDLNELKKKSKNDELIILEIEALNGKNDVVGSKLLKLFNYVKDKIIKEGWKVKESSWFWKKNALFYYIVEKKRLSKEIIHYGPPKKLAENVNQFRKKWRNHKISQDNYRVYVKLKRKYTDIRSFIKSLIKEDYVRDLVRKIVLK